MRLMLQIQLPDGSVKEYPENYTAIDVAKTIGERLAAATLAAEINGTVVDATRPVGQVSNLPPGTSIPLKLITNKDPKALAVMRHSAAHVMARAVMRLYPGVGLAFGPTTGHGFYYDFDLDTKISEDDFPRIEEEMKKIIADAEPFERFNATRDEAVKLCTDLDQKLKVEHIQTGLADHGSLSFYRQGNFMDLCRGPHVPDAGKITAIKLISIAGSYWKGDANNKQLQRLYGTAWFSQKDLDEYIKQVDEAKKRDHRVLGKQLGLFSISQDVGPGLCLWLPKGSTVRATLEDFIKKELLKLGYTPVYSPHIGRVEMYEISGHFPYYRDAQFSPIFGHDAGALVDFWIRKLREHKDGTAVFSLDDEQKLLESAKVMGAALTEYPMSGSVDAKIETLRVWEKNQERYLLKPMNCPHHVQMSASQQRSYRDLPVRLAEFGTVYRHEKTGELNGMLRVRGLTQDDAHLFCTPDQVEEEFKLTLGLVKFVLNSVGLDDYRMQLSLRDSKNKTKYVGSDENWDKAETTLRKVLTELALPFTTMEGEAAFYGPKIDFMVRDCIGREWQLGTVQLDFNLPERFKLEYIGADNKPHRPVMIHRAPFGSMERFTGMLIEHFAGAFPLWLAPEQVRVLPVSDKFNDYAQSVERQFREAGFRITTDYTSSRVNAKVREAQLQLIPYMLIVGEKEAAANSVALRDRIDGDLGVLPIADAIAKLQEEVAARRVRQVVKSSFRSFDESGEESNEY
ncbi:MAG: threonyl-tRNA synthetase [Planctomycetota bacterium]|nr:MAG: threonyl-tRNA synthetase [Planctomycetota bacterium]